MTTTIISQYDIIQQFRADASALGVQLPETLIADGQLHRAKDTSGKLSLAYKIHTDGYPAGYFEDFRQAIKANWKYHGDMPKPSRAELAAARLARNKLRQQEQAALLAKQANAAARAKAIWRTAPPAQADHPYLLKKQVQPHHLRQRDNALIVPIYSISGNPPDLVNLQFIFPDPLPDGTNKRFMSGGKKQGCLAWLGTPTDTVLIAEGFATAATVHEATGFRTIIAFDAKNLIQVTPLIRQKYPNADIIVMADNDPSGVGQQAARQAALICGGKWIAPPTAGQDFNDYANQRGN